MGFIYQIKNDINEKIYVGKTIRTLEVRFKEHKSRINERNSHLYLAMRKYGVEHFSIEILEECEDNLLNEKEQYWIKKLNSYNNGYNETLGGEGLPLIDYESQIKPLWDRGFSVREISSVSKISPTTISNYLYANGFTEADIYSRANNNIGKKNSKPIQQYDFDGNFIAEYPSLKSIPNICHRNISDVINKRRKSAGGYLWKYSSDNTPIEELVLQNKNKYKH